MASFGGEKKTLRKAGTTPGLFVSWERPVLVKVVALLQLRMLLMAHPAIVAQPLQQQLHNLRPLEEINCSPDESLVRVGELFTLCNSGAMTFNSTKAQFDGLRDVHVKGVNLSNLGKLSSPTW